MQPPPFSPHILVVDDEPAISASIRRSLPGARVTAVATAADATAAVADGADGAFDVVLLDLGLPDSPGATVYERLLAIDRSLTARVVIMTGGAVGDDDRALVERMGDRVLTKPFGMAQLRAMVNRMLGDGDDDLTSAPEP